MTSVYSGKDSATFACLISINVLQLLCEVAIHCYPYGHATGNGWNQKVNTSSLIPEPKLLRIMMVKDQFHFFPE